MSSINQEADSVVIPEQDTIENVAKQAQALSYEGQIVLAQKLVASVRSGYRKIWQAQVDVISAERSKENTLPVIPGFEYELSMTRNCKLFDPTQPIEEQYITLK